MSDLSGFTPEMAADPRLPLNLVGELLNNRPDLHPALAWNPSLTPEMRAWLAGSPNPAVQQALAGFAQAQQQVPQTQQMPQAPQAPVVAPTEQFPVVAPTEQLPAQPQVPAQAAPSQEPTAPEAASAPVEPAVPAQPEPPAQPEAPAQPEQPEAPAQPEATALQAAPEQSAPEAAPAPAFGAPAPGAPMQAGAAQPAQAWGAPTQGASILGVPAQGASSPYMTGSVSGPMSAQPSLATAASPKRPMSKAIIAVIAVAALVLVIVLGVSVWALVGRGGKGAASPEKLSEAISTSVEKKDLLGLVGLVSPAEMDASADLFNNLTEGTPYADEHLYSAAAIKEYMARFDIRSSEMVWQQEEMSDNIAILTLVSWDLDMTVDPELASDIKARYEKAKGSSLNTSEEDFFDSFRQSIEDEPDHNGAVEGIDNTRIVAVKEGGRWYISPTMTTYEAYTEYSSERPDYDADYTKGSGGDNPVDPVVDIADALLNSADTGEFMEAVAPNLVMPERRALMVYGPALAEDGEPMEAPEGLTAKWEFSATEVDGDTIVGFGTSSLETDEITVSFDGAEVTMKGEDGEASVDFGRALSNPERLGVTVKKEDGKYYLSVAGTFANLAGLRATDSALSELLDNLEDFQDEADAFDVPMASSSDTETLREFLEGWPTMAAWAAMGWDVYQQMMEIESSIIPIDEPDGPLPGTDTPEDEVFTRWDACWEGDMVACDWLSANLTEDDPFYNTGVTCGWIDPTNTTPGQCVATYGEKYTP